MDLVFFSFPKNISLKARFTPVQVGMLYTDYVSSLRAQRPAGVCKALRAEDGRRGPVPGTSC